jgi:hypothetical protein
MQPSVSPHVSSAKRNNSSLIFIRVIRVYYAVFEVLRTVVMKSAVCWDTAMCCPLRVNQRLEGTFRLHLQSRRISEARHQRETAMPSTLKMETTSFSEIFVDFQLTTRRYIPEDPTVQSIDCFSFPRF